MITVKNIHKYYGTGQTQSHILRGIDLTIEKGEFCIIYGASGSGKTTLLNVMSTLEQPDDGVVLYEQTELQAVNGEGLRKIREAYVGHVFQSYNLFANLTARENVMIGGHLANNLANVDDILTSVGLIAHKDKFPHQLSGGQQQRIAIARAIAKKPKIIFCDEPTGALDSEMSTQILALLQQLQKEENITIVMVTHDAEVKRLASKVVYLHDGMITAIEKNDRRPSGLSL